MASIEGVIAKYGMKGRRSTARTRVDSIVGNLFLTKMLKNPNYKTTITLPGGNGIVTGFCEGPFAFQGKADWKPIVDLGSLENDANSLFAILSAGKGLMGDENISAQMSFKQVRGTELRWAGSGIPIFQMKLILPSYDSAAKQSPMDSVRLLMGCVYPSYSDTEHAGAQLTAPLGYGFSFRMNQHNDAVNGTVTVSRGKFFKAPGMLIHSVSSSFSQECMEDGYPLYTEVNIEFGPWRMPSYEQVMKWFII